MAVCDEEYGTEIGGTGMRKVVPAIQSAVLSAPHATDRGHPGTKHSLPAYAPVVRSPVLIARIVVPDVLFCTRNSSGRPPAYARDVRSPHMLLPVSPRVHRSHQARLPPHGTAMRLRAPYNMPGTDLAYSATSPYAIFGTDLAYSATIPYAMSGTDLADGATSPYAMSGTDLAYGATRSGTTAGTRRSSALQRSACTLCECLLVPIWADRGTDLGAGMDVGGTDRGGTNRGPEQEQRVARLHAQRQNAPPL
eukprot:569018-Rhodomonas_salina.2